MSQSVSTRSATTVGDRTAALIDLLFPPPRSFGVRLPDGAELPGAESPEFKLVLKHPGALRRMVAPPIELSMGESFIYGDFEIEGDIFQLFSIIDVSLTRKLFSRPDRWPCPVDSRLAKIRPGQAHRERPGTPPRPPPLA